MSQREWSTRLHLPTAGATALIVAVWSLLSWRYGAYVLPSPLSVVLGFAEIVGSGEVWRHTGASLARILVGFGGAVAAAIVMALAAFVSRPARGLGQHALALLNAPPLFRL